MHENSTMKEKGELMCNTAICELKFKAVTDAIEALSEQNKQRFDSLELLVRNGITNKLTEHSNALILLNSERQARQALIQRITSAIITVIVGAVATGATWLIVSYSKSK